jgi:D-3-phosphoglycerate dehydrogenase
VSFATATRAGRWTTSEAGSLPRLRGQTLGLVGYGRIARAMAPKAHAFGLRVIATTPRLPADALGPRGTATTDLDTVLRESDYLSLHVPLTAETRGLIDERALRLMKPTAILINTSRGAVVDEAALARALAEGRLGGAALDVLSVEPPAPTHPLLALENVIVTPHVAFSSRAATAELARKAATAVAHGLRGELPPNVVNPAVLHQPVYRLGASPAGP